jgi:hypothetical protein
MAQRRNQRVTSGRALGLIDSVEECVEKEARKMNMPSHLDQLRAKHEALSQKIEEEQKRPGSDDLVIASMKREKLQLKDEITRLSSAS